jgi:hypothetical protein
MSRRRRKNSSPLSVDTVRIVDSKNSHLVRVIVSPSIVQSIKQDDLYTQINNIIYNGFDFLEDEIAQRIHIVGMTHVMFLCYDDVDFVLSLRDGEFLVLLLESQESKTLERALTNDETTVDFSWAVFIIDINKFRIL